VTVTDDLQDGDTILGDIPEHVRRLLMVSHEDIDAANAFIESVSEEVFKALDADGRKELFIKRGELEEKARFSDRAFWTELRLAFPELLRGGYTSIVLRAGWKVGTRNEQARDPRILTVGSVDELMRLIGGGPAEHRPGA